MFDVGAGVVVAAFADVETSPSQWQQKSGRVVVAAGASVVARAYSLDGKNRENESPLLG